MVDASEGRALRRIRTGPLDVAYADFGPTDGERCTGVVSVNGYLIQDIAPAGKPLSPQQEAGFWYFFYFATERGRAGLDTNRREIARTIWTRNSPAWHFTDDVPAVTLGGGADGNFPATDGSSYAQHFRGRHAHHVIPHAGHNLPQEAPRPFADAVVEVAQLAAGGAL